MDILIALIIIPQCRHTPNHHIVHLKYLQFLFVNHTSVKLGRGRTYYAQRENQQKLKENKGSVEIENVRDIILSYVLR